MPNLLIKLTVGWIWSSSIVHMYIYTSFYINILFLHWHIALVLTYLISVILYQHTVSTLTYRARINMLNFKDYLSCSYSHILFQKFCINIPFLHTVLVSTYLISEILYRARINLSDFRNFISTYLFYIGIPCLY